MIRRLYINNFRCMENFALDLSSKESVLLIGKNGAGKSTVGKALSLLQQIARGRSRISEIISVRDFYQNRKEIPIRFELEATIGHINFQYILALELPEKFKELRVVEESLTADGQPIYNRELAKVHQTRLNYGMGAQFTIDWHFVALPIIQEKSEKDPLSIFKLWLSRMLILQPEPKRMIGESEDETLYPDMHAHNFGSWLSGLLLSNPAAYADMQDFLKEVMPDLERIKNPIIGSNVRSVLVEFSSQMGTLILPFNELSDGEKCFMLCSLVLAANRTYGPIVCFWDEPDNYLALPEVQQFIRSLRRGFHEQGQFIATSHNSEAIRSFSSENTWVLMRNSHLEPTQCRSLRDFPYTGDVISSILSNGLEL